VIMPVIQNVCGVRNDKASALQGWGGGFNLP
jgi:hypothetical protein